MLHSTFTCHGTTVRSHWQRSGTSACMCTKTGGIKNKKREERESDHMLTWCLCLSVWFKNSISVRGRKRRSCGEAFSRGRRSNPQPRPACKLASPRLNAGQKSHLSDVRSYLTSLRNMAPFRGCHRVQCCVMRLFTIKKKKKKKSTKKVW